MPTEQDIQSDLQRLTGQTGTGEEFHNPSVMVVDVDGGQSQMEVNPEVIASMGVGMSQAYMAKNGPIQPIHRRKRVTMTKVQLEEQKMNEAQGLPSNSDEASRVKDLENKVAGIEQGVGQILAHLRSLPISEQLGERVSSVRVSSRPMNGGTNAARPQVQSPPTSSPSPILSSPEWSLPQPQKGPIVPFVPETQEALNPSLNDSESSTAPRIHRQRPAETLANKQLGEFLQVVKENPDVDMNDFVKMTPELVNELSNTQPLKRRTVKMSDGRTMEVGGPNQVIPQGGQNLGLGPGPVDDLPAFDPKLMIEQPEETVADDLWVEEPEPIKNDPRVEKLAFMVGEVVKFLRDRDPLLFFRRVLPKTVGRQVGFSAWPKDLQVRFCVHFKTLLTDPVFIKSQVATALSFEFGHGLSFRKVAELITLSAGFMSYSLSGAEVNT